MSFRWRPGDPPPPIGEHSKAKLTVLRRYLRAYFDRLSVNPSREEPVTVQTMRHMLANRTAARFSDLDDTVLELAREKEIDILNADGKLRSRSLRRLRADDRIAMPRKPLLPGLSFRR